MLKNLFGFKSKLEHLAKDVRLILLDSMKQNWNQVYLVKRNNRCLFLKEKNEKLSILLDKYIPQNMSCEITEGIDDLGDLKVSHNKTDVSYPSSLILINPSLTLDISESKGDHIFCTQYRNLKVIKRSDQSTSLRTACFRISTININ